MFVMDELIEEVGPLSFHKRNIVSPGHGLYTGTEYSVQNLVTSIFSVPIPHCACT